MICSVLDMLAVNPEEGAILRNAKLTTGFLSDGKNIEECAQRRKENNAPISQGGREEDRGGN